jgi:hypothetical protein
MRAAASESELLHLVANELRKLVGGRQVLLLRARSRTRLEVVCISSLAIADRETPFVRWIEGLARRIVDAHRDDEMIEFELPAFTDESATETQTYPFAHFLWQPLRLATGDMFAAVLLARERPWAEQDKHIIRREAGAFAGAWQALYGAKALRPRSIFGKRMNIALAIAMLVASVVPVPMTTLAPMEIVAKSPQRVTAPIDGVIKDILVEPNRRVRVGELLLRFDETTLRNRLHVAQQEMMVAQARYDRATQAAFADERARHDLAQARAELDLKRAEQTYAADLLARSTIAAERDGILLYSDKERWIGRPVKTGERILQIVDPLQVIARIDVAVADAIVLERNAGVRMFLDASPLTSFPARLVSESYHAEPNSTQQLVYRLFAEIDGTSESLRIGARGTAQLLGSRVPLAYYLFRRPISAFRQRVGL